VDPGATIAVVLFAGIAGARYYWSEAQRITRSLRAAKRWPIAELPENTLGRVIGLARAIQDPLIAPLTGRACVYYIATVKKDSDDQDVVVTEHKGVPFSIEDPTGRAIVDPTDARITLVFDHTQRTGSHRPPNQDEETLLLRHGYTSKGKGKRQLSAPEFSEAVIEIGDQIAVLGSGIREPDLDRAPASAYREGPPTLLRLTSSARYPLLISDEPSTTKRT